MTKNKSEIPVESYYPDYNEDPDNGEDYLQTRFPKFYQRIIQEVNLFWFEILRLNPEIGESKKIEPNILKLISPILNYRLMYDTELLKCAMEFEKKELKTNNSKRMHLNTYLDEAVEGLFELPRFILSIYSFEDLETEIKIKNLENSIEKLVIEKEKYAPLVERAKKMSGKKISPEQFNLYKKINLEHKRLLKEFGSCHKSSPAKATFKVLKGSSVNHNDPSIAKVIKLSKAYSKYFQDHPYLFS